MRHTFFVVITSIFALAVTMSFNNCAGSNEGNLFSNYASECEGAECGQQSGADIIALRVNQPETFWVDPLTKSVNIGGDCNEGGFDKSRVSWKLYQDGIPLINSEARYATTLEERYRPQCNNGRFSIQVDFMDANGDFREGLYVGDLYLEHQVLVEIFGIDSLEDGTEILVANPALTPESVILQPISLN